MTDYLEIPTFLLRGHPDCKVSNKPSCDESQPETVEWTVTKPKLTAAYKGRIAQELIGVINGGADTFGKIRNAMPRYEYNELRSAIRYAKKWIPMVERRGTRAKPQMHQYQARIEQKGRRYEIITY
mgnify:FL=1